MSRNTGKIWTAALLAVALLAVLLFVPSATFAEEAAGTETMEITDDGHPIGWTKEELPEYVPVELTEKNPQPLPFDAKPSIAPHDSGFLPDHAGYLDSTLSVRIETRVLMNTKVFFTFIQVADPTQLRTETFNGQAPIKDRAERARSVLAINGDWFKAKEKQGHGIIYRNGKMMRNVKHGLYDGLFIDDQGDFHVMRHPNKEDVEASGFNGHIMNSFVFGPALVIDGQLVRLDTTPNYTRQKIDDALVRTIGTFKQTQRTALCQMGPLSYLVITAEGPEQSEGGGFSTDQMARLAYDMGAQQAFNLDGGTSACLVLGGERLNALGNGGKSNRAVGDMVYFVTLEP